MSPFLKGSEGIFFSLFGCALVHCSVCWEKWGRKKHSAGGLCALSWCVLSSPPWPLFIVAWGSRNGEGEGAGERREKGQGGERRQEREDVREGGVLELPRAVGLGHPGAALGSLGHPGAALGSLGNPGHLYPGCPSAPWALPARQRARRGGTRAPGPC